LISIRYLFSIFVNNYFLGSIDQKIFIIEKLKKELLVAL